MKGRQPRLSHRLGRPVEGPLSEVGGRVCLWAGWRRPLSTQSRLCAATDQWPTRLWRLPVQDRFEALDQLFPQEPASGVLDGRPPHVCVEWVVSVPSIT